MKTRLNFFVYFLSLLTMCVLTPVLLNAQSLSGHKTRLQMISIVDGKKTVIDTTFNSNKEAMEYRMELETSDSVGGNAEGKKMRKITIESTYNDADSISWSKGERGNRIMFFGGKGKEMIEIPDFPQYPGFEWNDSISLDFPNLEELVIDCPQLHGLNLRLDSILKGSLKNIPKSFNFEFKTFPDEDLIFGNGEFDMFMDKNPGPKHRKHIRVMRPGNSRTIIMHTDSVNPENNFKVKKFSNGEKTVILITRVEIDKPGEADKKMLKKAGVTLETSENRLELEELVFYPNPNDGKFELSFHLSNKSDLNVRIYDSNGKEIYADKHRKFEGNFNEQIDISKHGKGTFFLQIEAGSKKITKKVMVQ